MVIRARKPEVRRRRVAEAAAMRAGAEARFGWQRRRPFDPAHRDLRMNCAASQFTSRRTPRCLEPANMDRGLCSFALKCGARKFRERSPGVDCSRVKAIAARREAMIV